MAKQVDLRLFCGPSVDSETSKFVKPLSMASGLINSHEPILISESKTRQRATAQKSTPKSTRSRSKSASRDSRPANSKPTSFWDSYCKLKRVCTTRVEKYYGMALFHVQGMLPKTQQSAQQDGDCKESSLTADPVRAYITMIGAEITKTKIFFNTIMNQLESIASLSVTGLMTVELSPQVLEQGASSASFMQSSTGTMSTASSSSISSPLIAKTGKSSALMSPPKAEVISRSQLLHLTKRITKRTEEALLLYIKILSLCPAELFVECLKNEESSIKDLMQALQQFCATSSLKHTASYAVHGLGPAGVGAVVAAGIGLSLTGWGLVLILAGALVGVGLCAKKYRKDKKQKEQLQTRLSEKKSELALFCTRYQELLKNCQSSTGLSTTEISTLVSELELNSQEFHQVAHKLFPDLLDQPEFEIQEINAGNCSRRCFGKSQEDCGCMRCVKCAICEESLLYRLVNSPVGCQHYVHSSCLTTWETRQRSTGVAICCIICRAKYAEKKWGFCSG